ncbi:MAG: molybdopterin-dependent oxidoreductase [Caldilineaceae bacterium]
MGRQPGENLDFLVVQELFLTETAQKADVVLPAVSWAEQDGTFTNVERRVQRAPKAFGNPESKAAPDWLILDHLASHVGAWSYTSPQGVTLEISQVVPIYAGLYWEALGDQGLQWDADLVRPQPSYRKAEQPDVPEAGDAGFYLVGSTVLLRRRHALRPHRGHARHGLQVRRSRQPGGRGPAAGERGRPRARGQRPGRL